MASSPLTRHARHKLWLDRYVARARGDLSVPDPNLCNAETRAGTPCKHKAKPFKGKCRLHGGLSTGPKTEEGKQRIREAQLRRRLRERILSLRARIK